MQTKFMIYACGGTGINLIQEKINIPKMPTHSATDCVRIDLSTANLDTDSSLPYFLIPGINGAGKHMGAAVEAARPHIPEILKKHQPGTFNVVLYGTAGGSGAALGPLLIAELNKRGVPTIGFLVGATTSGKETENTYKGFLSLQAQVNRNKLPIAFSYYENSETPKANRGGTGDRSVVDQAVADDISTLAMLVSEQHRELDRLDITNFLRYDKVTKVKPQLTELMIGSNENSWSDYDGKVIATASLMTDMDHKAPDLTQPYKCEGFYQEDVLTEYGDSLIDTTFALTSTNINGYVKSLKVRVEEFEAAKEDLNTNCGLDMDGLDCDDDDIIV